MNQLISEAVLMDNMEYMAKFPDKFFDLAIVDPPYRDINQPTKHMRQKVNGKMNNFGYKPKQRFFNELKRVSKNQIIWGGNNFFSLLGDTNCFIFWYKQNPMDNYSDGELAWTSFNTPARCFNFIYYGNHEGKTINNNKYHPTQKPIALYTWLLQNYANPNDKILDTHLGSGSSRIAAYDLGFDFYSCELDKDYFYAQEKRFAKHIAQQKIFAPERELSTQTTLL